MISNAKADAASNPYLEFNRMIFSWKENPPATDEQARQLAQNVLDHLPQVDPAQAQRLWSGLAEVCGGPVARASAFPGWGKSGSDPLAYKRTTRLLSLSGDASRRSASLYLFPLPFRSPCLMSLSRQT